MRPDGRNREIRAVPRRPEELVASASHERFDWRDFLAFRGYAGKLAMKPLIGGTIPSE